MNSEIETGLMLAQAALGITVFILIVRRGKAIYFGVCKKLEEARRENTRNN